MPKEVKKVIKELPPEEQRESYEWAKKLEDAGFRFEGCAYWANNIDENGKIIKTTLLDADTARFEKGLVSVGGANYDTFLPAPDAMTLWNALPYEIRYKDKPVSFKKIDVFCTAKRVIHLVQYEYYLCGNLLCTKRFNGKSLADACAEMLIWLKQEGLLKYEARENQEKEE